MSYSVFHKQYIISSAKIESDPFEQWNHQQFYDYHLYIHPNLQLVKFDGSARIYLLGFCFHAEEPEWDCQVIAEHLSRFNRDDFLNEIDLLCGVFLVIRICEDNVELFHDASGTFKVFYYLDDKSKVKTVAYDPNLILELEDCEIDESIEAQEFYGSTYFKTKKIRVGNLTSFLNLIQLLPNHTLNLTTNKVTRYYPRTPLNKLQVKESVRRLGRYFNNITQSANSQYELKYSITAGWDSKLLLSFTRKYKDEIKYFTFYNYNHKIDTPDFTIAKQIAKDFNLDHVVVTISDLDNKQLENKVYDSFQYVAKYNITYATQAMSLFKPGSIFAFGLISEVTKNFFRGFGIKSGIEYAFIAGFPKLAYPINYFDEYVATNFVSITNLGYDFDDIAHWEQNITNFAGQRMAIYNTVSDNFAPFNCRKILDVLLSVDKKYRNDITNRIFKMIIDDQWPELNTYQVNPGKSTRNIFLKDKLGIYQLLKRRQFRKYAAV